ncbi:MAG: hypothetical protein ACE5G7_07185 [Candidatus Hydrothermarchaeaceae archaeon]
MVEPIAHYLIPMLIPLRNLPDLDFLIGHLYLLHKHLFAAGIPVL